MNNNPNENKLPVDPKKNATDYVGNVKDFLRKNVPKCTKVALSVTASAATTLAKLLTHLSDKITVDPQPAAPAESKPVASDAHAAEPSVTEPPARKDTAVEDGQSPKEDVKKP